MTIEQLRTAAGYRLTQDARVIDGARRIAVLTALVDVQGERITERDTLIAAQVRAYAACDEDRNQLKARAEVAERKVRNRTPWAWVGRGLLVLGVAGGITQLTNR